MRNKSVSGFRMSLILCGLAIGAAWSPQRGYRECAAFSRVPPEKFDKERDDRDYSSGAADSEERLRDPVADTNL